MLKNLHTAEPQGFLPHYRLPALSFVPKAGMPEVLLPIWEALNTGNPAMAEMRARHLLRQQTPEQPDVRAALKSALAAAALFSGATDQAKRLAGLALDVYPAQWLAHRIILSILAARRAYKAAYMHLARLESPGPVPLWDEPLSHRERQHALAAWSWQLAEWDTVAAHLQTAYPEGVTSMPRPLQADWFRLCLYRNDPDEAASAAALLIAERPAPVADEVLQTLVQCGWPGKALPLYWAAYRREPGNELLRRRLVALCIREGQIEQARELTRPGALSMAA
ncbi:MAG: hypothetical protein KatS3mg044_0622 [Rhodothermaceae bacterium]|nr:MAG: hypothetical protein KatS3mg044_0622 [Rhodothermaceae bacterium]